MQKHTFYRIINIIVLPLSAYLAINVLMSIIVSLTNPLLLLFEFIIACVPLYAFTSNYFYNKGIKKAQSCKPALKDWIKVNAYVSFIFALFMIFLCMMMWVVLNDQKMLKQVIDQLILTAPSGVSETELVRYMKIMVAVCLPFFLLLIIHIIITFRLLKQYRHIFDYSANNPE